MEKFYITTAIPYVNAKPHVGFALELIQTDVLARYHRVLGDEVFFLTGTDEDALKNVQAAEKAGREVKDFIDEHAEEFKNLAKVLNISNDDFIRTTEHKHIVGSQKLWRACDKSGDIYKKKYKGLYCVGCETFYTPKDLVDGLCPEHKTKPEEVEEENYFFRLSKYQKKILEFIESDKLKITPEFRKKETVTFIKQGLEDFSISRSRERARNWGIPVPGDNGQIIYVWFDALTNYINAIGYGDDEKLFNKWWQTNNRIVHLIGKGITRFHAIYWPAMLLSAGLNLPSEIIIHGYVTVNGEKISKSLGNIIDPVSVVKKYGVDPFRYYILREIPSDEDGDFSTEKLEARYNGDLANNLGNLISRVAKLIETKLEGELNFEGRFVDKEGYKIEETVADSIKNYRKNIEAFRLHEAIGGVWALLTFANGYIDDKKPWAEVSDDPDHFVKTITSLVYIIINAGWLIEPFMPETADNIFKAFGFDKKIKSLAGYKFTVAKIEPLFPRLK